jgi:hypothetical protein
LAPFVKTTGDGVRIEFGSVVGGGNQDIFSSGSANTSIAADRASGTDAMAPIRGIYTMTLWTTKEILLDVCAGRERQTQSHDDPVKHGDAPHRFYSL